MKREKYDFYAKNFFSSLLFDKMRFDEILEIANHLFNECKVFFLLLVCSLYVIDEMNHKFAQINSLIPLMSLSAYKIDFVVDDSRKQLFSILMKIESRLFPFSMPNYAAM